MDGAMVVLKFHVSAFAVNENALGFVITVWMMVRDKFGNARRVGPVEDYHDVFGEIKIEKIAMRVLAYWFPDNECAEHSVPALQGRMRMPEMRARGVSSIPKN